MLSKVKARHIEKSTLRSYLISMYLRNQSPRNKKLSRNRKAQPSRKMFQPRLKIYPALELLTSLSMILSRRRKKKLLRLR